MLTNTSHPIGIFDSGIGGTSIWNEIQTLLPLEDTIYLADSKHAPYGEKSPEEILALCIKNTEFLIANNCKLIVVACNTATTNAIQYLRKNYAIPFIGIEPAIKLAALQTLSNTIGVLATKGTLSSALFTETAAKIDEKITLVEQVGEGLVTLIEQGQLNSSATTALLHTYLQPMLAQQIDCLVLGCTHYPYLIPQIQQIVGAHVQIIDSGAAVAKQTKAVLERHQIQAIGTTQGSHQMYSNANTATLQNLLATHPAQLIIQQQDF